MKTYTLKLKTTSTTDYNLYDGTTLVSDTDLGTLFGSAGEAYFVFDFDSLTPSSTTALTILDSNSAAVITNTGLTGIAENKNFKGTWSASATAFSSFVALAGVAMDEAQLSRLIGVAKDKVTVLTAANYNYPTNSPNGLAPWLLDPGMYYINASPANPISLYSNSSSAVIFSVRESLIVNKTTTSSEATTNVISYTNSSNIWSTDYTTSGTRKKEGKIITSNNLVSSTGTSTTDVMSQNAVTGMVYADPSTRYKIKIGGSTTNTGQYAIALGASASASAENAEALGYGANASHVSGVAFAGGSTTAKGVMQIGLNVSSGWSTSGYNNSAYRLLTGLYDGQSAHDAATLAQGNTLGTSAPTTSTAGVIGQLYTDTSTVKTYQCTAIDTTDPQNPVYTWTARW